MIRGTYVGAIVSAADPNATVLVVDGMNHVLVDASTDRSENFATYGEPTLPLDVKLVPAIAQFLKKAQMQGHPLRR